MEHFSTSCFSYNAWAGISHPLSMPRRERNAYSTRKFNAYEVNSTFYTLPEPHSLKAMPGVTREGSQNEKAFVFANNYWCGQPVSTIRQLKTMLE